MPETPIDSRPHPRLPGVTFELVDDGQRFLLRFRNGPGSWAIDDWPYAPTNRAEVETEAKAGLERNAR